MTIELISEKEKWDGFVEKSPYGFLFHTWDFLKIIEKHSGFKLLSYGIYKENELLSIIPLFYHKKFIFKMVFSPPPRSAVPYLGLLVTDEFKTFKQSKKETCLKTIFLDISSELNKLSAGYVNIATAPNISDIRQFKWNGFTTEPRFNYILDLTAPLEKIWNGFKQEARKGITKAERGGYRLDCGDNISGFYQRVQERYKEQKLSDPLLNETYLVDIKKHYPNNIKLYNLYDSKDDLLTCVMTQQYKNKFVYWIGSTRSEQYANEYLIWRLIQKAKSEHYTIFDFTGANTENICRFKSKFNPQLEFYFNVYRKTLSTGILEYFYKKFALKRVF